jgi:hypothetical protein
LWIEVRTFGPAVLELDAQRLFSVLISEIVLRTGAFWREPFKTIKVFGAGQAINPQESGSSTRSRCAKIPKIGQQTLPEPLRLAGEYLPGHAMACSL